MAPKKGRSLPAAVARAARGRGPFSGAPLLESPTLLQAVASRLSAGDRVRLKQAIGPTRGVFIDTPVVWHTTVIESCACVDAAREHAHLIRELFIDDTCDVDAVQMIASAIPHAACTVREPFAVFECSAGEASDLPVHFHHVDVIMEGGVRATPSVLSLAGKARSATFLFQRDQLGESDLSEYDESDAENFYESVSTYKLNAFEHAVRASGCPDVSFEFE